MEILSFKQVFPDNEIIIFLEMLSEEIKVAPNFICRR